LGSPSRLARRLNRRQQECDERSDDRDDHEKLDQGKSAPSNAKWHDRLRTGVARYRSDQKQETRRASNSPNFREFRGERRLQAADF
jgi:hypothetical protein